MIFKNLLENWIVWAEIMISKGDFESGREKLMKALECDPKAKRTQRELRKLEELIEIERNGNLDEQIIELANFREIQQSSGQRYCNNCVIF